MNLKGNFRDIPQADIEALAEAGDEGLQHVLNIQLQMENKVIHLTALVGGSLSARKMQKFQQALTDATDLKTILDSVVTQVSSSIPDFVNKKAEILGKINGNIS